MPTYGLVYPKCTGHLIPLITNQHCWRPFHYCWGMKGQLCRLLNHLQPRAWIQEKPRIRVLDDGRLRSDLSQFRFTNSHRLYLIVTRALSYQIKWVTQAGKTELEWQSDTFGESLQIGTAIGRNLNTQPLKPMQTLTGGRGTPYI